MGECFHLQTIMLDLRSVFLRAFPLMLCLLPPVYAAEPVLADGLGLQITSHDVLADAQRIPPELKKETLSKPGNIEQLAVNLFVRRALAAQAERDNLGNDPTVAAALQLARDRVLSDAQLLKINEASKPSDAALDAYASAVYKSNPKRFEQAEQVRARHILVAAKETNARSTAEKLLSDLKAGADFDALAKTKSQDPGSASRGGDLGFFARGRMAPAFEEAAFALVKPGDLSGVVETSFGFHIIRLEERKAAGPQAFAEVREQLRQEAVGKIQQDARAAEAQRLTGLARFNKEAIEAFAASQR